MRPRNLPRLSRRSSPVDDLPRERTEPRIRPPAAPETPQLGARVGPDGVRFGVWAPQRRRVAIVFESGEPELTLVSRPGGWFEGTSPAAAAGSRYRVRLDDEPELCPDPASRFQPDGPFGPSEAIDPSAFAWSDAGWKGLSPRGQAIYEMHVGAFTPEGTWAAAAARLPDLARLGVSVLELMPVADFPGRFGWGYDGVNLFAPTRLYGRPDDFRRFVDQAHALGLGVVLDVVYNHLGPSGNFLKRFAPAYFSERHVTEWGDAMNFDGPDSGPVRAFFAANAARWIAEYHLDGLRLDATQSMFDDAEGRPHVIAEIAEAARAAAPDRSILLIAENEPQASDLARPLEEGGCGLDALWNDDLHHSAMVALTGRADAYYMDYCGKPQEFVSAAKRGFLYQGQRYRWQGKPRGSPTVGLAPQSFVGYLQNHDQIANSAAAARGHELASPARWRAMTALLLLGPWTPMLFMGQEFGASSPFYFFADHEPELASLVQRGRAEFLAQFPNIAEPAVQARLQAPHEPETFRRCKLDWAERAANAHVLKLHVDLLALRRKEPLLHAARADGCDGAVLGDEAFLLRYFGQGGDDRLLVVNFGADRALEPAPEPLLAPPADHGWRLVWHSEHPDYGGVGVGPVCVDEAWKLPGRVALFFAPERAGHGAG